MGNPGPKGTMGIRGPRGIEGERGAAGPRGEIGPKGRMGLRGPRGLKGNTGIRGPRGVDGPKGEKGEKGDAGGPQGPRGKRGRNGARGQRGPPGRSARSPPDVFKRKHARVKLSWPGSKFESAAIECGYGNDAIPIDINADGNVDIGIADIRNWFGVRIEKMNVTNTGKHVYVLIRVLNFTNDCLMISILCPNDIIAQSDVVSMDESEPLNESSLGPKSYRMLRPTVSTEKSLPSTTKSSKSIVAVLGPGESCFFRPQLKSSIGSHNSRRKSCLLLLADTIQVKDKCLEYSSTWEEVQCGRLLRPPTFDEVVLNWAGVGNSSSSDEEDQEEKGISDHRVEKLEHQKEANLAKRRKVFVEALSNPVVRLQMPTSEELNKTVGCSSNYELIESVLRHLRSNDSHVSLDSDDFCCFFLEFLLTNVLTFLTRTGWEVDSLQETNGCTLAILTATTRLAFSYVNLPSDICNTFLKRASLSGGFPG